MIAGVEIFVCVLTFECFAARSVLLGRGQITQVLNSGKILLLNKGRNIVIDVSNKWSFDVGFFQYKIDSCRNKSNILTTIWQEAHGEVAAGANQIISLSWGQGVPRLLKLWVIKSCHYFAILSMRVCRIRLSLFKPRICDAKAECRCNQIAG